MKKNLTIECVSAAESSAWALESLARELAAGADEVDAWCKAHEAEVEHWRQKIDEADRRAS